MLARHVLSIWRDVVAAKRLSLQGTVVPRLLRRKRMTNAAVLIGHAQHNIHLTGSVLVVQE